jgi:transposase-like protein
VGAEHIFAAIDSNGYTVEFWFSERRNVTAAKRSRCKALRRHGRPERIVIDGSQTNREAILSRGMADRFEDRSRRYLKPIRIRQSAYLHNRIEQIIGASSGGFDQCSGSNPRAVPLGS